MKKQLGIAFLALLFCGLLVAAPATAQIAGFKISDPVISGETAAGADADFDVLAYGSSTAPSMYLRAGSVLANSSSNSFTQTYSFGNGARPYQIRLFVNSDWNTSAFPALSFGDGSIQQTMALALETSGSSTFKPKVGTEGVGMPTTFRGSFSHTYPNGSFDLKSYLTPAGTYGAPNPGVNAEATLTQGTAFVGTLSNTFTYQVTVSALSPPGTGTYYYQTTQVNTNTYPSTVLKAVAQVPVVINATPPTLTVDGGFCPGNLDITITGGTPGARVTFWASDDAGSTAIGVGPCAATIVELDTPGPRRQGFFDGSGEFSFSRNFFPTQCSVMMQAVNHGNCAKSDVELPPAGGPPPPPPGFKPSSSSTTGAGPGLASGRN